MHWNFVTPMPPDRQAWAPMWLALQAAQEAIALSDPNPRVGCVITAADGRVLGQGHTQLAGGPHAEVMALRDAQARGLSVQGATAWVTLEPCAHHGRTPPCADALVREGLARVVVALHDPNPLVAGQGTARLRAAGIEVVELPPDATEAVAARELNIGFLSRMVRKRPWVRVKMAASLDGRTALPDGRSQWITQKAARLDGHDWRARATAVLTGIGTVLADDPRLDVRSREVPRQPLRLVMDRRWRTPLQAAVLRDPAQALVIGLQADAPECSASQAQETRQALQARQKALVAAGVSTLALPALTWPEVLVALAERGVNELHVEAGATLTGSLIASGLADEWLVYLAPKLLGSGRPFADLPALGSLDEAPTMAWHSVTPVGADLRLLARRPGAADF